MRTTNSEATKTISSIADSRGLKSGASGTSQPRQWNWLQSSDSSYLEEMQLDEEEPFPELDSWGPGR